MIHISRYSILLKDVKSDGNNAFITLVLTAPEGVNGYMSEDDGDGKANPQNVILNYSAGTEQMRDGEAPFAEGKAWSIYWQDIYGSYLNEQKNEGEKVLLTEGTWSIDVIFENVTVEELEMTTEPLKTKVA